MGDEQNVIRCTNCNAEIGRVICVDNGQERLQAGGILVNVARGVCIQCGAEFHWSISERMLAELVQQIIEMRKNVV